MATIRCRAIAALVCGLALAISACGGSTSGGGGTASGPAPDCGFPDRLVQAAKAEGAVTIYAGGHTRKALDIATKRFQKAYGIRATGIRQTSSSVVRMLQAELAAGNLNADVVSLADPLSMQELAKKNVFAPSIAPNLADLEPGIDDPTNPQVPFSQGPIGIMSNTARVPNPPKTWQELLHYPGRIAIADPNSSGSAMQFFSELREALGPGYLRQLKNQGKVIVTDSGLALPQLVITGEADVAIPGIESSVNEAVENGEPLSVILPSDGVPTVNSEIAPLVAAKHPNAAKLFAAYHLCPDYQQALVQSGGRTILKNVKPPANLPSLDSARVLSLPLAKLAEAAPVVRSEFGSLFR